MIFKMKSTESDRSSLEFIKNEVNIVPYKFHFWMSMEAEVSPLIQAYKFDILKKTQEQKNS